jgi:transcription elongation factor SPT6
MCNTEPAQAPKKLYRRREDEDAMDEDQPRAAPNLTDIFADDTVRRFDQEDDEMADFIEDDEDEGDGAAQQREKAPKASSAFRGARTGFGGAAAGVSQEAWEEIQEIFGNGDDYRWAMDLEEDAETQKAALKLEDVRQAPPILRRGLTQLHRSTSPPRSPSV